jgi:hypothetical protein
MLLAEVAVVTSIAIGMLLHPCINTCTQGGRRTSISSKQVHWKLPGTFTEGDLERFLAVQRQGASITTDAISQALQEAWEMAGERG